MASHTHTATAPPSSQANIRDYRDLRQRAAAMMQNYPDLHSLASKAAREILKKHTDKSLEPSTVYWHRFNRAMSSPHTFTGWQHTSRPTESMTLTELVMHRFSGADQEAPDELNVYGGFYTAGPDQPVYDEKNEVPILPSAVLADFWALDFAAECKSKVRQFWRQHSQDFSLFAKVRLLSSAGLALNKNQLTMEDFHTVLKAVTGAADAHVTQAMLEQERPFADGVSMQLFTLAGESSRNTLCISDAQGRRILYSPQGQSHFLTFDDDHALGRWVDAQLVEPAAKAALVSRFSRDKAHERVLGRKLVGLAPHALTHETHTSTVSTHVFSLLRDRAHQEMREDVHRQLTSNASLRKQIWIRYLGAFIQTFGAFAPIGWPVVLTLIGAGIASVGLNIDQAVNGRTSELRRAGVIGAIVDSVYLLFNLPFLADLRRPAPSVQVLTDSIETEAAALDRLAGNTVLDHGRTLGRDGRYPGVHVLENGETWIRMSERSFRVQHVDDLKLWFIVDPENPFSFNGARLVRLNDANQWELAANPGLKGGMHGAAQAGRSISSANRSFETVSSEFWDIHMQFNLPEEERLSALANQRQETLFQVYDAAEEAIVSDSDGEEIAVDAEGEKHRLYKIQDDWRCGTIHRYTQDEDAYNVYLRTGRRIERDQITAVERLVKDLAQVGHSNDVALYRGGSGERGTSGVVFRSGRFKTGDVLVNTDITSFSENPYMARVFASSQAGTSSEIFTGKITFDDTSVVFELPAKQYLSATPISPFSATAAEAESVFTPGKYFEIHRIEEVAGSHYRFMHVSLKEVSSQRIEGTVYDLRTGVAFSRERYSARLGADAQGLVDKFFPVAP